MSHWSTATQVIKQAALPLGKFSRGHLVRKMHIPGTPGLRKALEKRFRTLELIKRDSPCVPGSDTNEDLRDPVWMTWASRNIYDR